MNSLPLFPFILFFIYPRMTPLPHRFTPQLPPLLITLTIFNLIKKRTLINPHSRNLYHHMSRFFCFIRNYLVLNWWLHLVIMQGSVKSVIGLDCCCCWRAIIIWIICGILLHITIEVTLYFSFFCRFGSNLPTNIIYFSISKIIILLGYIHHQMCLI
jgi:hypothetical protein